MSEPKRIALTTLVTAEAATVAATQLPVKKEKKSAPENAKTQRFILVLPVSTEKSCPEFNFSDLITSSSKKKENHSTNGSTPSANVDPLDPFGDNDEDQLRNIAKKFEEKYGLPTSKKKKSRKYDDYVDLGAGYDENDPFIDNTDAYDEIVPAEMTTAHGGFYINSGALEFKAVEKQSDSESESESSSSESDSDDSMSESSTTPVINNKKRKQVIESDSSNSEEDVLKNGSEVEETVTKKKKAKVDENVNKAQQQIRPKKGASPSVSAASGNETHSVKKSRPTVKDLLQSKREKESNDPIAKSSSVHSSAPAAAAASSPTMKETSHPKKDKDGVEAPKAHAKEDSSSDSSHSSSDSSDSESGAEDEEDGKETAPGESEVDTKLPSNLSPAILAAIEDIKKAATSSAEQGKCRFFSPEVNRLLLSIELHARQYSCSKRQAIYSHLAGYLPCTKHTLLKRAKNLVLEDVDAKLKPAIKKLQNAVEKVMGEQIERHATQCQRLAEANPERYLEYYRYVWDPDLEPAGGTDEEDKKPEKGNRQPQPRRKFQWSKEIRGILIQVVYLKAECFNWAKLRKETATDFLMRFLNTEIRVLWPKGWMTAKILYKESQDGHSFITSSKSKSGPAAKKPATAAGVTPRTGLIDTLAPLPSNSSSTTNSTQSTTTTTPSVAKEVKKSQLKERMAEALRSEVNSPHNRSDFPSNKTEKIRPDVTLTRTDGSAAKSDPSKPRQRPDPTCSAARTEIHVLGKTSDSNKSARLDGLQTSSQHRSDSSQLVRPEVSVDAVKQWMEQIKASLVPPRLDTGTKSNKADSSAKARHEASVPSRPPDGSNARHDSPSKVDQVLKTEAALPEQTKSSKNVKAPPALGPSLASSLASFVDSGLRWKGKNGALDLSEDPHRSNPKPAEPPRVDISVVKSAAKTEEPDSKESQLERDLAMVMEEITQITRQENRDPPSAVATSKATESRTKSVIKATGRASPGTPAPPLTFSNPTPKPQGPNIPSLPPKLTPGNRGTPPAPVIPRISPTSGGSSSKPISSFHSASQGVSSTSGNVKSAAVANMTLGSDFSTPPNAHSSSRQFTPFFSDDRSPEKTKMDGSGHYQQPSPAHQQLTNSVSIARSSPNAVYSRNFPTPQTVSPNATSANRTSSSHSIESLMQLKTSYESSTTHRPVPQVSIQQHTVLPKQDPLSIFKTQKNSQTPSQGDQPYYSQSGSGHYPH